MARSAELEHSVKYAEDAMEGIGRAVESLHAPGSRLGGHRHRRAYAALVLDGAYEELSVDGRFECTRGSLVLHPAHHAHTNAFTASGARVLNLFLAEDMPAPDRAILLGAPRRESLERLMRSDPARAGQAILEEGRPLPPVEAPAWLGAMAEALAEGEETETVGRIARRMGVSAAHASRAFVRQFGLSPTAFRREHRMRRALALLAAGKAPAAAAAEAGFADQSHLGRILRREIGATPTQMRCH